MMAWEKNLIDKELDAVKKEMQGYRGNNDEMTIVLEHLENIYHLLYTLYKKRR